MRVAVIGGGVAGLSAALELRAGGAEAVVFEASARAGGKVGSVSERGYLSEDGPHFIAGPLDALLDSAGLRGEVVLPQPPKTRWVQLGGRVLRAPSLGLLARAGPLRAFLEPLLARPLRDGSTLREFLVERLGARAGALAAAVMAAGVYAGDPGALGAAEAFPSLAEPGSLLMNARRRPRRELWTLRGGMGSLPQALAALVDVRLSTPVTALQPAGGGWELLAGGAALKFDALVLALPASAAAQLLQPLAPAAAEGLSGIRAAAVTVVHLGFPQAEVPRGFGLIDADGALHATGTLLPSSMLPGRAPEGRALVTCICGGARHPERAQLADEQLVSAVRAELLRTFGIKSEPDYVRLVRHTEAIPQPAPGHRARVQAVRQSLAKLPPLELAGASVDGVSVPDVARSGSAAARRLLARR